MYENDDLPDMTPIPESYKDPIGVIHSILQRRERVAALHLFLECFILLVMVLILWRVW